MDRLTHGTECSSQLTPKLSGVTLTSVFSTYIRDSVRNTVACMFGSKTLCLFRHFYLLERRKIIRRYGTSTDFSCALWIRLLKRHTSLCKHCTALQDDQECFLVTSGTNTSMWDGQSSSCYTVEVRKCPGIRLIF